MKTILYFILSSLFISCIPFKKEPVQERYVGNSSSGNKWKQVSKLEVEAQFKAEKESEWKKIEEEAVESFEEINALVTKKCASCHDSDKPLPFYGKIYPKKNIFKKHRDDGLDAVNFVRKFPLKAKGNPPQLAILKSIRSVVTERTMPIKAYTYFYPFRKINQDDERRILAWIDPLIDRIERFNEKYEPQTDNSPKGKALKVFNDSCIRCHGNGNNRGGFSGLENLDQIAKSSFVNIDIPEKSEIYQLVKSGEMPLSASERLSEEEVDIILDWIRSLKK
jgi:hypothetical protein